MTLQEKVDQYIWFHSIDLGGGVVTSGNKSLELMKSEAELFFSSVDLNGKSFLDVGAWNGGFSLEAARRGAASVTGIDNYTWNHPQYRGRETYDLVSEATDSHFEAVDINLDAPQLSLNHLGQFDIVLFAGVFYHLQDPLAATREVAALAREVLILETHIESIPEERPAMVYFPGAENADDPTNWWGPNVALIRALLTTTGFARVDVITDPTAVSATRGIFHAYR